MKLLALISLLLFLTTVFGHDDIGDERWLRELVDDEEDEADQEDLDPENTELGLIGDRCGNSNPCAQGLDCLRVPLRKRCYPVTCGVRAVRHGIEQTGFNLGEYGRQIMGLAKVNNTKNMFRTFPDMKMNLANTESNDFQRVLSAIQENRPPVELIVESFNNCTGVDVNTISRGSTVGMTPYFGGSWELGFLGTYNADIFWGQGTADLVGIGILNNCFGAVLGYDAGISGLLGMAFSGAIADLSAGCKQVFPIADFPPFGLQLGFINDDIPTFLMEFNGGASASAGLQGYTSCTTRLL